MYKSVLFVFVTLYLLGMVVSCDNVVADSPAATEQLQSPIVREPAASESNQIATDNAAQMAFNETVEKYYDYFMSNNQIVVLLAFSNNDGSFTDDALAGFVILSLVGYDYDNGNTKEEYNTITEKYFGTRIQNFNNMSSEIIPNTNMVRAT